MNDPIPPLSRHTDRFVDRNLFLHALLGLVSYGGRFSAALNRLAPPVQRAGRVPSEPMDRETLVVLGLISIWRRVELELSTWAMDAPTGAPDGRGIARRLADGLLTRAPRSVLR